MGDGAGRAKGCPWKREEERGDLPVLPLAPGLSSFVPNELYGWRGGGLFSSFRTRKTGPDYS